MKRGQCLISYNVVKYLYYIYRLELVFIDGTKTLFIHKKAETLLMGIYYFTTKSVLIGQI